MDKLRLIFSAGGTGGHIFPAVAVAREVLSLRPDTEILFVGALGKMEMEKVPEAGFEIVGLPVAGLKRSFSLANLALPFKVMRSLSQARRIMKQFKPHAVVGFGGYASFATGFAARMAGIPLFLQEQNAFPGLTNRILSRYAKQIFVASKGLEDYFPANKISLLGNPVRPELEKAQLNKTEAVQRLGFNPELPLVFITGGSLGALAINQGIEKALTKLCSNNIQVYWQSGKHFAERAENAVNSCEYPLAKTTVFCSDMLAAYAAADLVVSRAGAIALAELAILQKPAILVPLPTAAENHQYHNALALQNNNAAWLLQNAEATGKLGDLIISILQDASARLERANNIKGHAFPGAAKKIAESLINELA
jgi:UDP-N-acetylglucosamine--N-acetylmuramyl-(pentapeptide) pyrophosphoryl-undecaprenol N-acetylglucosamine transferase